MHHPKVRELDQLIAAALVQQEADLRREEGAGPRG
jgi:hypothetical protein